MTTGFVVTVGFVVAILDLPGFCYKELIEPGAKLTFSI